MLINIMLILFLDIEMDFFYLGILLKLINH